MDLVKTKLDPPSMPGDLLVRPRLLEKLRDAGQVRLTVLQAPAGYGKTSLLSQWFHALREARSRVGWLSVDDADRDPVRLLAYVGAAIAAAGLRFDDGDLSAATESTSPEPLLTSLVNALKPQTQPVYLFIDDIHLLAPAPLATLCQFMDHCPATLHFILASRVIPDIPLARMRARGQLLELGVEDLKLTAVEARQFVANAAGDELNVADLTK
jgi:LuxR family transcriptional regulator, maltose regulon positive regulatory protein